jgi:hypothetical protein
MAKPVVEEGVNHSVRVIVWKGCELEAFCVRVLDAE